MKNPVFDYETIDGELSIIFQEVVKARDTNQEVLRLITDYKSRLLKARVDYLKTVVKE